MTEQRDQQGTPARRSQPSRSGIPARPGAGDRGTRVARGHTAGCAGDRILRQPRSRPAAPPSARWDADRDTDGSGTTVGLLDEPALAWPGNLVAGPAADAGSPAEDEHENARPNRGVDLQAPGRGTAAASRPMTPFDVAAYGLGVAAFAGVMLACLAVLAMGGLTTIDVAVGLVVSMIAVGCGCLALLRLRRETARARRLAAATMAVSAIGLPILWVALWNAVIGL